MKALYVSLLSTILCIQQISCMEEAQSPSSIIFPKEEKCPTLTMQIYNDDLTSEKLETLFKEGANINCQPKNKQTPLSHWCCISRKNKQQAATIITTLLKLGIKPIENINNNLSYVIDSKNIEYTKIMAPYATKTARSWDSALFSGPEYIDVLIKYSQQKDLDMGLMTCVGTQWFQSASEKSINYKPEIMEKLIKADADIYIALDHLIQELPKIKTPTTDNHPFYQNFAFLLKHGAFSQEAFDKLLEIRNIFELLICTMQANQSKKGL